MIITLPQTYSGFDSHGRFQTVTLPGIPDLHPCPRILSAHRYVPSCAPHRSPEDVIRRLNAYALKSPACPEDVVDECAIDMARLIAGPDCILVPIPAHDGTTATTRRLAEAIALHADCDTVRVADILTRSAPVPSSCDRHRAKLGPLPVAEHHIVTRPHDPFHLAPVYYVDNVATSGNTITAAAAALCGFGTGLVYADARR